MTTARLAKRLAINAGALAFGNTMFTTPLVGGALANFTSLKALASLGLSMPMARNAVDGLRRDMRPNADFLTVTSIVASLLLGNAHSALMILALSDTAEPMTSYTIVRTRSSIKKMLSADEGEAWKALKMLVIDYACRIKLSTATAFSAAINTAMRQGVLIKGCAFIEQMQRQHSLTPSA